MKVLFLDVDGVLNCTDTWRLNDGQKGTFRICPERAARLTGLLLRARPRVVMSSTWRKFPDHMDYLTTKVPVLKDFLHKNWRTPEGKRHSIRGHEIAEWLESNSDCISYAIVDDNGDMLEHQLPFFVQTHFSSGLTDDNATRLFNLLK